MKSFFRSPPIVSVVGWLIWVWMRLLSATIRWQVEGEDEARMAWAGSRGAMVACWHRGILLMPAGWRRHVRHWPGRTAPEALISSLSPDGQMVARAVALLGIDLFRGSSANKKKAKKDKRGVQVAIESIRRLRDNGSVWVTLDGPRGPPEQVTLGSITIAQHAGTIILPYGISAAPRGRLATWDGLLIPPPFARGAIVFGPMLVVGKDDDPEALRAELQRRMDAATRRADELVGIVYAPPVVTEGR
jgi:lysophospholipid acyltransferase (LPLAT)-like uncharacterized protein